MQQITKNSSQQLLDLPSRTKEQRPTIVTFSGDKDEYNFESLPVQGQQSQPYLSHVPARKSHQYDGPIIPEVEEAGQLQSQSVIENKTQTERSQNISLKKSLASITKSQAEMIDEMGGANSPEFKQYRRQFIYEDDMDNDIIRLPPNGSQGKEQYYKNQINYTSPDQIQPHSSSFQKSPLESIKEESIERIANNEILQKYGVNMAFIKKQDRVHESKEENELLLCTKKFNCLNYEENKNLFNSFRGKGISEASVHMDTQEDLSQQDISQLQHNSPNSNSISQIASSQPQTNSQFRTAGFTQTYHKSQKTLELMKKQSNDLGYNIVIQQQNQTEVSNKRLIQRNDERTKTKQTNITKITKNTKMMAQLNEENQGCINVFNGEQISSDSFSKIKSLEKQFAINKLVKGFISQLHRFGLLKNPKLLNRKSEKLINDPTTKFSKQQNNRKQQSSGFLAFILRAIYQIFQIKLLNPGKSNLII